ncbi:hypothetical protein C8R46DRAFT_1297882 [Mycena filopes]|nr:hypothetical protein C8R46DRAFT_1297882 [Mycena filopes]
MHPALRLNALNALPSSQQVLPFAVLLPFLVPIDPKRKALAAVKGSEPDFHEIRDLFHDASMRYDYREKSILFLPVFYANLERAKIPTGDGLDDPSMFTAGPVYLAMISLKEIHSMASNIPLLPSVLRDLWPHLWRWVQFFDVYRPTVGDDAGPGVRFLKLVSLLLPDDITSGILASTPVLRRMVARSWDILLRTTEPTVPFGFDGLTELIRWKLLITSPADVEEFVEGAGGSFNDLATLILGYVDRIPKEDFGWEGEIFEFIDNVETVLGFTRTSDPSIGPLRTALSSVDAVASVTRMAYKLMRNVSPTSRHIPHPIPKAIHLLIHLFITTGSRLLPAALRAGLLYVVVSCSAGFYPSEFDLTMLVKNVLAHSLMSYSTLSVLESALETVEHIAQSPRFRASGVFEHWNTFIEISRERLAVFNKFNEVGRQRRKVCDNVQCGKIADHTLFKRCSICKCSYYCSLKCQNSDWFAGEHRKFCRPSPCFRLSEMSIPHIGAREREFMRALLDHEYNKSKIAVYIKQVIFMAENPQTPFFTLFRSSRGCFDIHVHPLAIRQLRLLWPEYDNHQLGGLHNELVRAAGSAHRMTVHVLGMPEWHNKQGQSFLLPLRSETSFAHNTLTRISKQRRVRDIHFMQLGQMIWTEMGVDDEKKLGVH